MEHNDTLDADILLDITDISDFLKNVKMSSKVPLPDRHLNTS